MLASAPSSNRIRTAGGISICVNGTPVDSQKSVIENSVETINNNVNNVEIADKPSEWSTANITLRGESQPVDINNSTSKLVHVIQVKPNTTEKKDVDNGNNGAPTMNQSHVHIKSPSSGTYINNNVGFRKDKISVMVGSPIDQIIKGEDERSSSGASSALGSDCERSDSDREVDDGTDSGCCRSRRHCARVNVTAIDTTNISSIISDSSVNESYDNSPERSFCNNNGNNVKLTISPYSAKDTENKKVNAKNEEWNMEFHLRELNFSERDRSLDSEDVQTKIIAAHALLSGNGDNSFSLKNKVRSSIVSLTGQPPTHRNYDQEEAGRVVFYTTSMGVVRNTSERCRKVRKILDTLMVKFEERDVFMNRGFQQEVRERLGMTRVIVPQVFVEGRHLGGVEVIEQLNEIGHLRDFLRPYKRQSVGGVCQQCGGYKFLLCHICGGSKKSVNHRHNFSEDLVALRCVSCDESGLIRCPQCINGEG